MRRIPQRLFVCALVVTPILGACGSSESEGAASAAQPASGAITLAPGFTPDPHLATGTAGGTQDATQLGPGCVGRIAEQPNHVLQVTAAIPSLRIVVSSSADTTLVVRTPDGSSMCNDDREGLNPGIVSAFAPGEYRVFVGAYGEGEQGAAYNIAFTAAPVVASDTLGALAAQQGGGGEIPRDCGMAQAVYGPIGVGTEVVLGRHTGWTGPDGRGGSATDDANWADTMTPHVGQRTVVRVLSGLDNVGCPGVRVAIDDGQHFWRLRDLTIAPPAQPQ